MRIITAAAVVLGAVTGVNAQVNFDRGVDLKSFLAQAEVQEVKAPEAKYGLPVYSSMDCQKVEFGPESPLTSPEITLRTTETYQDCFTTGAGGQVCIPRTEWNTETTKVIVTAPRELKEGQKEIFEVCLWGKFLSLDQVQTVYKYKVKTTFKGIYLTPQGPKAESQAGAGRTCRLALDAGRTCQYKCEDGSTFTQANPFPPVTPNPWVGQIYPPCLASAAAPLSAVRGNMWQVLSKIKLNDKQPDMNGLLVGLVKHGQNIDTVTRELTAGGFRVRAYQDNTGGYLVMAEVTAEEASDRALGLARYWYISEVLVGEKVFLDIFPKN